MHIETGTTGLHRAPERSAGGAPASARRITRGTGRDSSADYLPGITRSQPLPRLVQEASGKTSDPPQRAEVNDMMAHRRRANIGAPLAPLVAGTTAGAVAAAVTVAAQLLMGLRYPNLKETAWSAFAAGIAGGILYDGLTRLVRSPARALWAVSLAIAACDSLLVILLPLPAGHGPHLAIPIDGLVVPIRQIAALVGLGRFGARHFPAALPPTDTVLHFVPAVAVGALVPWLTERTRS